MMIGLLNRKIQGEDLEENDSWKHKETSTYLWQLSDKCLDLIDRYEAYQAKDENEDYDESSDFKP
jgi:hypothetical protein